MGEQPDVNSQAGWESMRSGVANPNEDDVPDPGDSSHRPESAGSVANISWSDRANDEARLQRMRPADLPRADSSSEAGASVAWRDAGIEEIHPPYEDLFAEAAREMERQTSVAGYPRQEGIRFLQEQAALTGVGHSETRSTQVGSVPLQPGREDTTSGVNLQELSLEQIYEALDPRSENPLLLEMRRRIVLADRASSRRSSEVTALEGTVENMLVQNSDRESASRVNSAQARLISENPFQAVNRVGSPGFPKTVPPLPVLGHGGQSSMRAIGGSGPLVSSVSGNGGTGIGDLVVGGLPCTGQPQQLVLQQDRLSVAMQSTPAQPQGSGNASVNPPVGSRAPSGLQDSLGFIRSPEGSVPVGSGGVDSHALRFRSSMSLGEPVNPAVFRHSPGYPQLHSPLGNQSDPLGSNREAFVTFRPKSTPGRDLIDLEFPPQVVRSGFQPETPPPAIVDLLDLESPCTNPAPPLGSVMAGAASAAPFQALGQSELGAVGGYSTPRARTPSRAVYTPGGTRVPDYPSTSPGYASPKYASRIL